MAEATLVDPKIKAGGELLQALDDGLGEVFTAFWHHDPESDDWRLIVGSDVVDREGPTQANRRLLKILKEKGVVLSPLEVDLVGRRHPLIEMLRLLRTQPMTLYAPMHIYRTLLGERYIDEAYVYRNGVDSASLSETATITVSPSNSRKRRRPQPKREDPK